MVMCQTQFENCESVCEAKGSNNIFPNPYNNFKGWNFKQMSGQLEVGTAV